MLPRVISVLGTLAVNNSALLGYSLALVALGSAADSAVLMVGLMGVTGITCAVN